MDNEQRQHVERLHQISLRRLHYLEEQIATLGPHTPAHVRIEAEDLTTTISAIERELGIADSSLDHMPLADARTQMRPPPAPQLKKRLSPRMYAVLAAMIVILLAVVFAFFQNRFSPAGSATTQLSGTAPIRTSIRSTPPSASPSTQSTSASSARLPKSWSVAMTLADNTTSVTGAAISPDGRLVATTMADNTLRFWDSSTGKATSDKLTVEVEAYLLPSLAFNPDGSLLVTAFTNKTNRGPYSIVRIWDAKSFQTVVDIRMDGVRARVVAFSSTGALIAVTAESQVQILEWNTQQVKRTLPQSANATIWSVVFSADDSHIVTTTDVDHAQIWNLSNGQPLDLFEENGTHNSAAFDPTNPNIVMTTSLYDNGAWIWELKGDTWSKKLVLRGGETGLLGGAFSQNGQFIATASEDRNVRIWELSTQQQVAQLAHPGEVISEAFGRDQRQLLTVCKDGKARIWQASDG